ncbi:MAG: isoleucine--tRNA ligase [Bacteroidetes bacterium]|nr:isoleucine--tRNA ligase [Bacteroidota bacterium]
MSRRFPEHKNLDLPKINQEISEQWKEQDTFHKSIDIRKENPDFIFFEGPPSANGMPGIHHVMARTIKDLFCRYKTQKGFKVLRKAGWDTHGLPVELGVEKKLGITKEDIGKNISIAKYNEECRSEVMKYTDSWEELTEKLGYWVDMDNPYVTYDNRYIETLWWLLKQMYDKGLLYKGYTIQPFSPAAGTGLSSHELNQPGTYKDVKDTTITALFKIRENEKSRFLFEDLKSSVISYQSSAGKEEGKEKGSEPSIYALAWTTTPWTLPSNTALTVGAKITYALVYTLNPYTKEPILVILAEDLIPSYFDSVAVWSDSPERTDSQIGPFLITTFSGSDLEGVSFEQLIPWVKPSGKAFEIICGDFVTTEDGTGIVHTAPTFGADDDRVAKQNGISPLIIKDLEGKTQPLVDRKGCFFPIENIDPDFVKEHIDTDLYGKFAGKYVKNEYDANKGDKDETTDIEIAVDLKLQGKAFKIEKLVHNYPHCWRTDKPILYYPLDSWFIKTTAYKDRLIELNKTINWKPETTGTGRFGNWLENLVDWNLSRSRFWGTPLPIWATEDSKERICIGSVGELRDEIHKSVEAGFMDNNPLSDFVQGDHRDDNYNLFDLHRPHVDDIFLVSPSGEKMTREPDLIDVWFDSGAMPFAQLHYPFEHKHDLSKFFPADFIAEGVDQTRGWFFTLHAIAVMLFDTVSFKNLVSHGLVLDKEGNKMSKRLGNTVNPFEVIDKYGSDPLRWYTVTNAPPWDNLKFDINGVDEVRRKFFGTLYNTYSFFSLYANVDGFTYSEPEIPIEERPEIDRWIISLLNSLVLTVDGYLDEYFPTKSSRAIQEFVLENLSNWYVRLCRKRFWGGKYDQNKISAYQTLYTCLETVAKLSAPFAPFYMDQLFLDLNKGTGRDMTDSVHLTDYPECNKTLIDSDLEARMALAQKISSMVLGLRRKVNIKVRQPLAKIMVPALDDTFARQIKAIEDIIKSEINVKDVEFLDDASGILVKRIKPNFKLLGKKHGKMMKRVSAAIGKLSQEDIKQIEETGSFSLTLDSIPGSPDSEAPTADILLSEVEIQSQDIPGWLVANDGSLTVALDITVTDELKEEGIAREFINRIQNLRKDSGFKVTDKISVAILQHEVINSALNNFASHIGNQTLAVKVDIVDQINQEEAREVELDEGVKTYILIKKV